MEEIKTAFDEVLEDMAESAEDVSTFIQDDKLAEWAIRKIKAETAERDRLLAIADSVIDEYKEVRKDTEMRFNSRIQNLKYHLSKYFQTVPHKKLKASEQYTLPSGKLSLKYPTIKQRFVDEHGNDDKGSRLVAWLETNGYEQFVKVSKEPAWGELKKVITPNGGGWYMTDTGEDIEGLQAFETMPEFEVK